MTTKIDKKIVEQKVIEPIVMGDDVPDKMDETVPRPELLCGSTIKIKTPQSEHALYVTINDVILNVGTKHEEKRPYEIFINSKNMEHYQWVVALTRVISAVFRKGGEVKFLVDELKAVFDPQGGYFKKGGVFMPSIVAEIGYAIETHLKNIGVIEEKKLTSAEKKLISDKRKKFLDTVECEDVLSEEELDKEEFKFPSHATLCPKCGFKSVVKLDKCNTCLNCVEGGDCG